MSGSAPLRIKGVPRITAKQGAQIPAPLVAGTLVVVVVSAGRNVVVLAGGDHPWTLSRGPVGKVISSALVGSWFYVIAGQTAGSAALWRFPLKNLLAPPAPLRRTP
jgi:hypothetical protein